jgi:hypothetical protein
VFGRAAVDVFVPTGIDNHAQERWAAAELEPIVGFLIAVLLIGGRPHFQRAAAGHTPRGHGP